MAVRSLSLVRSASKSWCQCRHQMSTLTEKMEAEARHAQTTMTTWKRVSLFVAVPVCAFLGYKFLIVGEKEHGEHGEGYIQWPHLRLRNKPFPWGDGDTTLFHNPHTNLGPEKPDQELKEKPRWSTIERLWLEYLHDDPEERDEERWKHLARMQKRKEDYLRKKAEAIDKEVPLQPMDLFTEMKLRQVKKDSGMEN